MRAQGHVQPQPQQGGPSRSSILLPSKTQNNCHFPLLWPNVVIQPRKNAKVLLPENSTKWGGGNGRITVMHFLAKKRFSPPPFTCFVQLLKNKTAILELDRTPYVICFHSSGSLWKSLGYRETQPEAWGGWREGWLLSVLKACHQPKHKQLELKSRPPPRILPKGTHS